MQAVILACEASDGLESITGFVPHPLLLIERHPLLDRLIKKLETAGISEILIAASADGPEIRSFVYRQGYKAAIATFDVPSDSGSAGAIKLLERLIHSTFLAVSINVVFDFDLRRVIGSHYLNSAVATVAVPSQAADDANDGMIPDSVIDSGVYMLEPELLRAIPARRSYNIMEELLPRLLNAGAPVNFACPSGYWAQLDSVSSYVDCQRWFLDKEVPNGFVHAGALIGPDVILHPPYYIGSGAYIQHHSTIGPYTTIAGPGKIGVGSVIENSVIYPRARIRPESVISGAVVFDEQTIIDSAGEYSAASGNSIGHREDIWSTSPASTARQQISLCKKE